MTFHLVKWQKICGAAEFKITRRKLFNPKNKNVCEERRFVCATGVRLQENKLTSHIIHSAGPRPSFSPLNEYK